MALLDVSAFFESRAVRYCQLVPTVLVVYEHLLQFNCEVDLFWRKRWSVAKILFIWSRYFSIIFNVLNTHYFMQDNLSMQVDVRWLMTESSSAYLAKIAPGRIFFKWQEAGLALQVITVHAILQLRLYAMYQSNKIVLAFFVFLAAAEAIIMGILVGYPKEGLIQTNEPSPGLFICADADPYHSPWTAFNWTTALVVETILLGMSMYKAWAFHRSGGCGTLVRQLTKDSAVYFFYMFWVYLANSVLWFVNKLTLTELGTGFFFGVCAILSHRILISVRTEHYDPDMEYDMSPSLRFRNEFATTQELETFAILTGHYGDDDDEIPQ